MNVTDVNSVIDNICSKIGTTGKMLVPEMAGYMIARYVIVLVLAVIFFIAAGFCLSRIVKMKRQEQNAVRIYKDSYDGQLKISTRWGQTEPGLIYYSEDEYCPWWMGVVIFNLIGVLLLCLSISRIVGWSLSPNAMTVMWIIDTLNG